MMDLNKGIKILSGFTKDKVVSYGESSDGNLVLITDIHGLMGCNHYIITDQGPIPTNPVICKLKNVKQLNQ